MAVFGRYRRLTVDIEREAFDAVSSMAQAEGVARPDIVRRALNLLFEAEGIEVRAVPTAQVFQLRRGPIRRKSAGEGSER